MRNTLAAAHRGSIWFSLVVWLCCSTAHAQAEGGLRVEVLGEGPGSCLTSEQLRARIAHYSAGSAPQRETSVVLEAVGRDAVELRILRSGVVLARRRFEQLPAPCADRRDAIALSIALALEHSAAATPERAPSEADETAAAPAEQATSSAAEQQPTAAEPARPSPQPTAARAEPANDTGPVVLGNMPSSTSHSLHPGAGAHLQLHLGGRWITQAAPMALWAGALGVQLALGKHAALDVAALASLPGETGFAGGRGRSRLLGLELLGCGSVPLGVFALQACAGAAAAACDVGGRGYPIARPDTTLLWAAGLARVMLRWPQAEVISLALIVQAHVNVSRPQLQVENASESLRPGWLGATLGLSLLWTLP